MQGKNRKPWLKHSDIHRFPAPEVTRAERKTIDMTKVFGAVPDRNVEEGLELFVSGRFSELCKTRLETSRAIESRSLWPDGQQAEPDGRPW